MNNSKIIQKDYLPMNNIKDVEDALKEFILWYDEDYCKNLEGAGEVVGQYLNDKTLKQHS